MVVKRAIHNGLGRIADSLKRRGQSRTKQPNKKKRGYAAAKTGRLFHDWVGGSTSGDAEIYPALEILRNRSRDLSRNNEYAIRFLRLCETNIVGHKGISLQVRSKDDGGKLDKVANDIIEKGWKDYCKKENCTVTGQQSIVDLKKIITLSAVRDGEILLRKITSWPHSSHGFAVQPIESDQLDHTYNTTMANGNVVVMGVEKDKWKRPTAYHLLTKHPGNTLDGSFQRHERERIDASEIIHFFVPERVNQTRGVPWLVGSAARCKMLDGYEEAELIAARTGAATMGIMVNPDGEWDEEDENGEERAIETFDAEPGTFRALPEGYDLKVFDPNHPNTAFPSFNKSMLRGIAAGWNVSYHSLANDLENINLSSIRHGEQVDGDHWRIWHTLFIDHILTDIFESWLKMFLTSGVSQLPLYKFDKFNAPVWRPRGWHRVDPDKESKASTRDIGNHTKSIYSAATEKGEELEEIFEANARALKLAEDYGLELHIFNGEKDAENSNKPSSPDSEEN
jgi:lambda family phage portal protein